MFKNDNAYVAFTYTDFGQRGRRERLGRHLTLETAARQFKRICKVYNQLHGHRVWTELRSTGEVIHDASAREPQL